MPDESWSGLIGARQACQTVYGQVPGSCITDLGGPVKTTCPGRRVPDDASRTARPDTMDTGFFGVAAWWR